MTQSDPIGRAILDYQLGAVSGPIITETNISDSDEMDPAVFFRDYSQMPRIEQEALRLATGSVLDVGCGAGSHALYLQNTKKIPVKCIDISEAAIDVCKSRGIADAQVMNLMDCHGKFDTISLLMNGVGIAGRLQNLCDFLLKLKSLLTEDGQILLDSSDIVYMFDSDDDGGIWVDNQNDYYGELVFNVSYRNEKAVFDWLYLSYSMLREAAEEAGLLCSLVCEGEHYDYLARLTKSR